MATIIDTLVLELGLDATRLNTGQQAALATLRHFEQEATSSGKRVEAETRKISHLMTEFRREAVTALGVFLGGRGVKEFVGYITSLDAATGRVAKTMNMSAEETSAWQGAIKQVGGTAESATSALSGLSGEINKFMLTGQTSMLGVMNQLGVSLYDQNKQLKTAGQLWLDISDAIEKKKLDPARSAALLSMIPGVNQDMINLLLKGRSAVDAYLKSAREAGTTTKESAAAAQEYQRSLSLLEQSATNVGRTFTTMVTPALVAAMDKFGELFKLWQRSPKEVSADSENMTRNLRRRFGEPPKWLRDALGRGVLGPGAADLPPAAPESAPPAAPSSGTPTKVEVEAYIRSAALSRGIDPNVAVRVAQSEGLNGGARAVGDAGSSFGPFQLHYGGLAGGPNAGTGLGDAFTRKTGLHARDSSTWKQQVDFSLDQARQGGWGPWHGWRGLPYAGISRPGVTGDAAAGNTRTTTVTIGSIAVNAPHAGDAAGIAKEIGAELDRVVKAGAVNSGPV